MTKLSARVTFFRPWLRGAVALLTLTTVSAASPPASPPVTVQPVLLTKPAPTTRVAASAMDEPLRLITEAQAHFEKVTDYTCTLVKKERINGQLTPDHVVAMSVHNEPFSVNLRWIEPKNMVGQEACYVTGRNDGKMRAKSAGFLGAIGFMSIDPTDPRALKTSKHAITEAGIGNMIQCFADNWEIERQLNLTQVHIGEYQYNKRRCIGVETIHPTNPDNQFHTYRTILYFDKNNGLPIRMECYDWPHRQGEAGELTEVVSFANLRLNVGVDEAMFKH
ncbi:MAG TPA: hypothetical protein DDY78_06710 [Planctomycetales bacterium]|jgi:outer membrane lipoprotein-sorting protein|nr:hypothetical protein [Planctomycetales bacterium]